MEAYTGLIQTIALTMGVAWASGINLYATLLVLGFMGASGYVDLPPDLQIIADPLVILAAGFMYMVEFFADKTPGVDTGWDAIHTFIRIPAGALLAAGAVGEVSPAAQIAAAMVGGSLAAGSHLTKAGSRIMINTSPEPFTNWTASFTEDIAVVVGLWAALNHPWAFIAFVVLFIAVIIWLLPKLFRAIQKLFQFIAGLFSSKPPQSPPQPPALP